MLAVRLFDIGQLSVCFDVEQVDWEPDEFLKKALFKDAPAGPGRPRPVKKTLMTFYDRFSSCTPTILYPYQPLIMFPCPAVIL